jgi:formiminotetrahydrofolate cyclodeaminase
VSESLWAARAEDLLSRTASADPTPGGGSVAAITGALGVGLMRMALAVTASEALLERYESHLASLQERIVAAADGDVHDFNAVMSAYRLPRLDDAQRQTRSQAIEKASITATDHPLRLVEAFIEAIALSHEIEVQVKASIVSDVLAGRDVTVGAARAAIRTADINIDQLDRLSSGAVPVLRARRDAILSTLEDAS